MKADVTVEDDVAAMMARTIEAFGQVDVLGNAATPGQDLPVWEQTLENWNATFAVDITAAMLCTREVLRQSMSSAARAPSSTSPRPRVCEDSRERATT
jgi:NAD(P)-dependent dehydrogenase (short-subunit alcohol dehydrogenase family)